MTEAHSVTFATDVAIVLGVAAVTSLVARRLRQPSILGYLTAGLIVGPYLPIPLFADPQRVESLAEFGVVLVMFAIGLEFRISKLMRVLPVSGLTGLVQVSALGWCGLALGRLFGWTAIESAFLGTGIAISSTMVVSKVYDQRPVSSDVREHVLGILVIQDVVAIGLIAAMTAVAAGGALAPEELGGTLSRLGVVLVVMLVGGLLVVPRIARAIVAVDNAEVLVVFATGTCFVLAGLAQRFGFSVALGAFVAGILVAESGESGRIEHLIRPIRDMFAAVFFVSIGMTVDPRQALQYLPLALVVTAVVIAGQFVTVSVVGTLSGNGLRRSIVAGLSLGQIGEFAFILSGIGLAAGVAAPALQPVLVTTAVLTAFTTPLAVGRADAVVSLADRLIPVRLGRALGLYEEWLARLREQRTPPGQWSPVRRAIRAIVLDTGALIVLLGVTVSGAPFVSAWLVRRFGLTDAAAATFPFLAAFGVSIPVIVALVANTFALSRRAGESLEATVSAPAPAARAAVRLLRLMVSLLVIVGVGVPVLAVVYALIGSAAGLALFGVVVLVVAIWVWRSASGLDAAYETGAATIAEALASQTNAAPDWTLSVPTLVPGLDHVRGHSIPGDSPAVGRTLAELDVRARTGATVVAVQRDGERILLPTGGERLREGDVVALTGTSDALDRAARLIDTGSADEEPEPPAGGSPAGPSA